MLIELISIIITGLIGIFIIIVTAKKPQLFWPILIAVSVGTGGLLIGGYSIGGYFWVDEYFLGCLIAGALLIKKVNLQDEKKDFVGRFHLTVFYLFIFYIIFQTVRGFFLWEGNLLKISRWIIYYSMLGVLAFLLSKKPFSSFNKKKAVLIIYISAFLYLLSYLMHGTLSGLVRGINWLNLQGLEWSGSAYATFPLVIAAASTIFLLKGKDISYRLLGGALLALGILISVYYSSRSSLLAVLTFVAFAPFVSKISLRKKIIILITFFFIALILVWSVAGYSIKNYYRILFGGGKKYEIWAKQGGDIDRYMHFRASIEALNKSCKNFFFGYGMYSHRLVLVPYLQELSNYYREGIIVEGPVRTESFEALLVDTGWIGISLLIMNFLMVIWQIYYKNKNYQESFTLFLVVLITFLWLFISNINDMVLLYLLIMPSGLILQLARQEDEEKVRELSILTKKINKNEEISREFHPFSFFRRIIERCIFSTKMEEFFWKFRHLIDKTWAESYLSKQSINHPHRKILIDKISNFFPFENVLEIGCASGPNLYLLAQKFPNAKFYGIDISDRAINTGRKFFDNKNINNVFLETSKFEGIRIFRDKSMDIVFTDAVLIYEGPKEIDLVIKEMVRIAKKAIILCEQHSNFSRHYFDNHWIHSYNLLFEKFLPKDKIKMYKIPSAIWGGDWGKVGYIIEAVL